jgi:hypothetical protein
MTENRTLSTRSAAAKANEALSRSTKTKSTKRKRVPTNAPMSKREKKEDDGRHQTVGDMKTEMSGQNEAEGKEKLAISPAESTEEQSQERPSIRSMVLNSSIT